MDIDSFSQPTSIRHNGSTRGSLYTQRGNPKEMVLSLSALTVLGRKGRGMEMI